MVTKEQINFQKIFEERIDRWTSLIIYEDSVLKIKKKVFSEYSRHFEYKNISEYFSIIGSNIDFNTIEELVNYYNREKV